jgi:hypothetical protein
MATAEEALVAKVLDQRKVVINRGSDAGVAMGQAYVVFERGEDVTDPASGESLGALELVKGKGQIIHVQQRMAILELEAPEQARTRTLSEIMATISSQPDKPEPTPHVKVGDSARPG